MIIKNLIIRFDADKRVGTGHRTRCFALGEAAQRQGFDVIYAGRHVGEAFGDVMRKNRREFVHIPEDVTWAAEAGYLFANRGAERSVIVLDISSAYAFEDIPAVTSYFQALRRRWQVVLIDGMWDNALLPKIAVPVDVAVIPYFGAEEQGMSKDAANVFLVGPQYFIISQEYENLIPATRTIRNVAKRLLVTMGGADPYGVTLKVLSALAAIKNKKLSVRIVIGSDFGVDLTEKIKDRIKDLQHVTAVIAAPESLLEHMLWCDLAITGSGLTKYEMALTGTPSLQISFSVDFARVNEPFVRKGSARHLGVHDAIPVEDISREIVVLIEEEQMRRSMSETGQRLLDGRGASRILEALRREL